MCYVLPYCVILLLPVGLIPITAPPSAKGAALLHKVHRTDRAPMLEASHNAEQSTTALCQPGTMHGMLAALQQCRVLPMIAEETMMGSDTAVLLTLLLLTLLWPNICCCCCCCWQVSWR
jgi:hypothetical protein